MSQQQQQSAKRFSLIFLSILCLALLGFAWMTSSRAEVKTAASSWDGTSMTEPATSNGVYQISTPAELAWLANAVNKSNNIHSADKVTLTADIDLGGKDWTPIGCDGYPSPLFFTGLFDGQGHSIKGLYISTDKPNQGLFGIIGGSAEIKNLTVEGSIKGTHYAGLLVGNADGSDAKTMSISNCSVSGHVICDNNVANHGIDVYISNSYAGGIAGQFYSGAISNCTVSGDIRNIGNDKDNFTGGIVGAISTASIHNCVVSGSVSSSKDHVGGIVGVNSGSIDCCLSSCTVSGDLAGGIAGVSYQGGTISNCAATGLVSGSKNYTGGIAGENGSDAKITNCGWLNTCASTDVGKWNNGGDSSDITSFDQQALDDGKIAVVCLPQPLTVAAGESKAITFKTCSSADATIANRFTAVSATVTPAAFAAATANGTKFTVTGNTTGRGIVETNFKFLPTWFQTNGDVSNTSADISADLTAASLLTVTDTAPVISMDAALPDGAQNEVYPAYTLTLSGGTNVSWSASGLPDGLALSGDAISGTPAVYGDFKVTVTASNSAGSASKTLTLKVTQQVTAPAITTTTLSNTAAIAGQPYQCQLEADGTSPIWSLVSGSLPDGITLTEGGLLSGTPTAAGTYTFTVQAKNSRGAVTRELTLTVAESGSGASHGSGGGCNAGFAALALLGLPFVMMRKKR